MIKSYVIDTNILIQAPYACQCFEENRVILPLVVLEELDGLKKAEGEKGAQLLLTAYIFVYTLAYVPNEDYTPF